MLFHTVSNQNTWTTKFVAVLSLKQNLTPTLKAAVNIKKCCNAWICASVVTVIIQRFVSAKNVFAAAKFPLSELCSEMNFAIARTRQVVLFIITTLPMFASTRYM